MSVDSLNINTTPLHVSAQENNEVDIHNGGPGTLYYKSTNTVSSTSYDGTIADGGTRRFRSPQWIVTTTNSKVFLDHIEHERDQINVHGIANTLALAGSADSPINVQHPDYGATGDGATDDTTAIQAAITAATTAGGIVFFPPGIYLFSSVLTVPSGVSLWGSGSAWGNTKGTVLRAVTNATAQIKFTGNTGIHQGFTVDGDGVANNPFRVDDSFGLTFIAVTVQDALQDNIVVYDAQQATFYSCNSTAATRDNLVLDGSAQSCLFSRFESASPGRYGILFGDDDGVYTYGQGFNRFDHCLVEQIAGVSDDPMVKITRAGYGGTLLFDSCIFASENGSGAAVVDITESATYTVADVEFRSCRFANNAGTARIALNVDIDNEQLPVVVSGVTVFTGSLSSGVKCTKVDTLRLTGQIYGNYSVAGPIVDASSSRVRAFPDAVLCTATDANQYIQSIASAATITLPPAGDVFLVTGTTNITSVTADFHGRRCTLIFQGILTFTDGSNLALAGDLTTSQNDTITLVSNGTNWYEVARSVN